MPHKIITFGKLHKYPLLFALGSVLFYWGFGYDLNRADFIKLLMLYAGAFYFYYKLIQLQHWNFNFLLIVGVFFRLIFFLAEPNLSQDFYRFIWDGELIKNGINPYLFTPNEILAQNQPIFPNAQNLVDGMGALSAKHYSNYPPVNQAIFALASLISGGNLLGSMIVMRATIILADIGILYFGKKLLVFLDQPAHKVFWYFLNPLVIIELTGNLHFEGVMLFFFIWSLYLISKNKWLWAAPVYAISIMIKLIPLLFLPIFLKFFGMKRSLLFYVSVWVGCILLLLPFYASTFIDHYSETVGLWFSNFEFNAGIYNLVKIIAVAFFEAKPWELIEVYGTIVIGLTAAIVLLITFLRKNDSLQSIIISMLLALSAYYLLSSTVHPWYLIFLLGLGMFTKFKFPVLWSFLVILSYHAYSNPDYAENLWLLAIEYILIFGLFIYEIVGYDTKKLYFFKNWPGH
ncbi:mannosyltransferase [Flagellimonas meishanensis]|uniref:mannosyltransferase n=1 Tax=Flagellimonas meishanensis TaxID=2873264 RepID=UPI001CA6A3B9|nr:mannosyltransferase [[Muricauda] meishanensis]